MTAIGIFFNISTSPAGTMGISTTAGTATNGASYDTGTLYFVGLIADSPIGSANFFSNSPGSGYNVDNLSYGNAATVLESLTLAMLLGACGAMRSVRKRRRQ